MILEDSKLNGRTVPKRMETKKKIDIAGMEPNSFSYLVFVLILILVPYRESYRNQSGTISRNWLYIYINDFSDIDSIQESLKVSYELLPQNRATWQGYNKVVPGPTQRKEDSDTVTLGSSPRVFVPWRDRVSV